MVSVGLKNIAAVASLELQKMSSEAGQHWIIVKREELTPEVLEEVLEVLKDEDWQLLPFSTCEVPGCIDPEHQYVKIAW